MKDRRRKPSKGVIVFASIFILIGTVYSILIIVSLCLLQFQNHIPGLPAFFPQETIHSTVFWLSTILSLLIMVCWGVAGIGLLILQEWARRLLLASIGAYFFNSLLNIMLTVFMTYEYAETLSVVSLVVGIILVLSLPIAAVYFFNDPAVIVQFKPKVSHRARRKRRLW